MVTVAPTPPRVLIIVQNLPVPFDRRVWLECKALTAAGYRVAVVCPRGPEDPVYAIVDGVELYKYRPYAPGSGMVSFVAEYLYSFLATLWLTLKASRAGRFSVIQSCNPPDIFWPIGLLFRFVQGSRFVFDHHDLCPELYESRFAKRSRVLYRLLCMLERRALRSADHVIVTNSSYRAVAIGRGGVDPARVTEVRTGPDPCCLRPVAPDPTVRRGRAHLVAYLGVMGPQDGVDLLLNVIGVVVHRFGRRDISFTLMGSGDCFGQLINRRDELDLADVVEFTGRIPDAEVAAILSSADVGICPDPKNPLNDVSTMNKTMEYMAFGLPVATFDLAETRISAGEAAVYATPNNVDELAKVLIELVDDEPLRQRMGAAGRTRVEQTLAWNHQAGHFLSAYARLVQPTATEPPLAGTRS